MRSRRVLKRQGWKRMDETQGGCPIGFRRMLVEKYV